MGIEKMVMDMDGGLTFQTVSQLGDSDEKDLGQHTNN